MGSRIIDDELNWQYQLDASQTMYIITTYSRQGHHGWPQQFLLQVHVYSNSDITYRCWSANTDSYIQCSCGHCHYLLHYTIGEVLLSNFSGEHCYENDKEWAIHYSPPASCLMNGWQIYYKSPYSRLISTCAYIKNGRLGFHDYNHSQNLCTQGGISNKINYSVKNRAQKIGVLTDKCPNSYTVHLAHW